MKHLALAFLIAACLPVLAHETDEALAIPPAQIELGKNLPTTAVIRISKSNPDQVEVMHVKEALAPGQKIENPKFEKIALAAEKSNVPYDIKSELDATSSTSSWSFFYGAGYPRYGNGYGYGYGYRGYGYGYRGYGYSYNPYYAESVRRGAEYYPGYYGEPRWNSYNGGVASSEYQKNGCLTNYSCPEAFYPSYSYAGYRYNYAPYYTYSDANYDYAYTGWGY